MLLNFRIVHIKEKTSKFCIFTSCFKLVEGSSFMSPINIFVIQLNFWNYVFCSKLPLDNFEIKFNSIKLILLCYNTYLCKLSLLYLFGYLFNILLIGWNSGIVPLGYVNEYPTMQFFTGISTNTQSTKIYILSLTECVWDFQNNALLDTH